MRGVSTQYNENWGIKVIIRRGWYILASCHISPHGYLSCVKVVAKQRGKGFGHMLMAAAMAAPYKPTSLGCAPYDHSTLTLEQTAAFYNKYGFVANSPLHWGVQMFRAS